MPDAPLNPPAHTARAYGLFLSGNFIAFCGTWMQRAAVGWLVWELTRSPAWVGAVALADLFSAFWVAPLAGAVADRNNPFKLQLVTLGLMSVLAFLLWAATASGHVTIWFVMAWAIADSTLQGFNQPVRMIAVNILVPRHRLSQAIASNSIAANLARSIGPALAGVVIIGYGTQLVFLISTAAYLVMAVAIISLRRRLDRPGLAPKSEPIGQDIVLGFSYVLRTHHIALLLFLTLTFALLARPFTELFPAIAGQVLAGGPDTLAMLMSAQGMGALVGATWMLRRKKPELLVLVTYGAAIGIGVTLVAFAFAPTAWIAVGIIGLAGLFHVVTNIGMQSLAQMFSEPRMRGRVVSIYGLIFRTGPSVGAFGFGLGAIWMPLEWLLALGGGVFALIVILVLPATRRAYAPAIAAAE